MLIQKRALQAALAASTADDTRYFLNGVYADPASGRLVATDGHVLVMATAKAPEQDEDFPIVDVAPFHGNPAPIVIPADVCRSMLKAMPKPRRDGGFPVLQCVQLSKNGSDDTCTVSVTDLQAPRVATIKRSETGTFPAYERVLYKADQPGVTLCLGSDVLETILEAAKAAHPTTGAKGTPASIVFTIPTKEKNVTMAVRFQVDGTDITVDGVAMPRRV